VTENPDILSNRRNLHLKDRSDTEVIQMIATATSVRDVVGAICYDTGNDYSGYGVSKMFKVNFSSIMKCGTVEFRQHIATTDCTAIIRWVRFVLLFVRRALETERAFWASLTAEHKTLPYLFVDFLRAPGLLAEFQPSLCIQ
jgi:Putative amidoligase enzyme